MKLFDKLRRKLNLTLLFSAIVFLILLVTFLFMGLCFGFAVQHGVEFAQLRNPRFVFYIMIILSLTFGVLFSFLVGRRPLRALKKLTAAMEEVAHGNFDTRIDLQGPHEFQILTDSFNTMAKELGSYEILRSDFVNNFSHEFKTPIVSVRGFAKLLKSDALTKPERDEYLDIIIRESDRLSSLAMNILNLSKVETLNIKPMGERFDLAEQIRRMVLVLEPKWSKKNIEPILDMEEVSFVGCPDLLGQVWLNLLDNAIKFSPPNSHLHITLSTQANAITVSMADQGRGMTAEQQKHIFDKFYQADTSHTIEGNGIGLAIVYKVLSLYQGTISCDSAIHQGTIFRITLPILANESSL